MYKTKLNEFNKSGIVKKNFIELDNLCKYLNDNGFTFDSAALSNLNKKEKLEIWKANSYDSISIEI